MHLDWSSPSLGEVCLLDLTVCLVVTNGVHDPLGDAINVGGSLAHVDVKGALENRLHTDSLLEQQEKVGNLHLEIVASDSLLAESSGLICWELSKESFHQTSDDDSFGLIDLSSEWSLST